MQKLIISSLVFATCSAVLALYEMNFIGSGPDGGGLAFALMSPLLLVPATLVMVVESMQLIFKERYKGSIYILGLALLALALVFLFFGSDLLYHQINWGFFSPKVLLLITFGVPLVTVVLALVVMKRWFIKK